MDHYYHYRPHKADQNGNQKPKDQPTEDRRPPRRILKKVLIGLGILVLIAAVLLGGAYVYITQGSIRNTDGRTNILILGADEVAKLSDTIMIASVREKPDGSSETVLVSIPRDLYVDVPGHGGSKINAAYALGENNDYTGGGPGLTADTVESEFGIPIHYYASLDFQGFKEIIDAAGGVEVEVQTPINDPYYPASGYDGYDPFSIEKGTHTLDGETALKYARSRKTTNDFDRAYRQQQVVLALRDKVISPDGTRDYTKIRRVLRAFQVHVDTNFTRLEMLALAHKLRNMEGGNVPQYVIDTTNFLTSSPQHSALVPRSGDFEEIQQFLDSVFTQESVSEFKQQF